jgi:hypothetical protein
MIKRLENDDDEKSTGDNFSQKKKENRFRFTFIAIMNMMTLVIIIQLHAWYETDLFRSGDLLMICRTRAEVVHDMGKMIVWIEH